MRDEEDRDSVLRALHILESRKRHRQESAASSSSGDVMTVEDGSTSSGGKRHCSQPSEDRQDNIVNGSFRATSLRDIVSGGSRQKSLKEARFNNSISDGAHRLSHNISIVKNSTAEMTPPADLTAAILPTLGTPLSERRRLSYLPPEQVEAVYARRSSGIFGTESRVRRTISQVCAAQTDLSVGPHEQLEKSSPEKTVVSSSTAITSCTTAITTSSSTSSSWNFGQSRGQSMGRVSVAEFIAKLERHNSDTESLPLGQQLRRYQKDRLARDSRRERIHRLICTEEQSINSAASIASVLPVTDAAAALPSFGGMAKCDSVGFVPGAAGSVTSGLLKAVSSVVTTTISSNMDHMISNGSPLTVAASTLLSRSSSTLSATSSASISLLSTTLPSTVVSSHTLPTKNLSKPVVAVTTVPTNTLPCFGMPLVTSAVITSSRSATLNSAVSLTMSAIPSLSTADATPVESIGGYFGAAAPSNVVFGSNPGTKTVEIKNFGTTLAVTTSGSVSFGSSLTATTSGSVSFGPSLTATTSGSVSFGPSLTATTSGSVSFGPSLTATTSGSVSFGPSLTATTSGFVSFGPSLTATTSGSVSFGPSLTATTSGSVSFGRSMTSAAPALSLFGGVTEAVVKQTESSTSLGALKFGSSAGGDVSLSIAAGSNVMPSNTSFSLTKTLDNANSSSLVSSSALVSFGVVSSSITTVTVSSSSIVSNSGQSSSISAFGNVATTSMFSTAFTKPTAPFCFGQTSQVTAPVFRGITSPFTAKAIGQGTKDTGSIFQKTLFGSEAPGGLFGSTTATSISSGSLFNQTGSSTSAVITTTSKTFSFGSQSVSSNAQPIQPTPTTTIFSFGASKPSSTPPVVLNPSSSDTFHFMGSTSSAAAPNPSSAAFNFGHSSQPEFGTANGTTLPVKPVETTVASNTFIFGQSLQSSSAEVSQTSASTDGGGLFTFGGQPTLGGGGGGGGAANGAAGGFNFGAATAAAPTPSAFAFGQTASVTGAATAYNNNVGNSTTSFVFGSGAAPSAINTFPGAQSANTAPFGAATAGTVSENVFSAPATVRRRTANPKRRVPRR